MSIERPVDDIVFYDSENNLPFAEAVTNSLALPSYFKALQHDSDRRSIAGILQATVIDERNRDGFDAFETGLSIDVPDDPNVLVEHCELVAEEGVRIEYEYFAFKAERQIYVTSIINEKIKDLSLEAAFLIHDEIQDGDVDNELKEKYHRAVIDIQNYAEIEIFTRRIFRIELDKDDDVDGGIIPYVRVDTDFGYTVDHLEVARKRNVEAPVFDEDTQFQKSFERDDILELVRALIELELVEQDDVKQFLDQKF